MIISFSDPATADLYHSRSTNRVRRFPSDVTKRALLKLDILNAAHRIIDLRSPPSNRLEALKGDLEGFYSIRVNQQWRVVFKWNDGHAREVSVVDYH